jgi:hypothetical protein
MPRFRDLLPNTRKSARFLGDYTANSCKTLSYSIFNKRGAKTEKGITDNFKKITVIF